MLLRIFTQERKSGQIRLLLFLQLGIGQYSRQGHKSRGDENKEEADLLIGADPFVAGCEKNVAFDAKSDGEGAHEYIDALGPDSGDEEEDDRQHTKENKDFPGLAIGVSFREKAGKILLQVRKICPGEKTSSDQQKGCCYTYPLRIFHDAK